MNQLTSLPIQHPTSKVAFSLRVKFTVLSLPCSTLGGLCSSHKKTCQVLPYFLLGASSLHSTPHALLLSFKHIEHIPTSGPLHLLLPHLEPSSLHNYRLLFTLPSVSIQISPQQRSHLQKRTHAPLLSLSVLLPLHFSHT